MHPIYENGDENEFASSLEGDDHNKDKEEHQGHAHHKSPNHELHITLNRKATAIVLALIIVVVAVVAAWQLQVFAKVADWYSAATVTITVVEKDTHHAIADAAVTVGGKTAQTNAQGVAELKDLHSGRVMIMVAKATYTTKSFETTIYRGLNPLSDTVIEKAPDKLFPFVITIVDAVAGTGLKGAKVTAGDVSEQTSDQGKATLQLKTDVTSAHIIKDGFQAQDVALTLSKENYVEATVELLPVRYMVFEQEKSGKTDLYISDLGTNTAKSPTVVRLTNGNGTSSNAEPHLGPDQKHIVFLSDRDGIKMNGQAARRLYVIDEKGVTAKATDDADPRYIGWANATTLVYIYQSNTTTPVQDSVVAYNIESKKRTVIGSAPPLTSGISTTVDMIAVAGDGQSVAYVETTSDPTAAASTKTIKWVKVSGGDVKKLSTLTGFPTDIYFTGGSKAVRYTLSADTGYSTKEVDISSGAETAVSALSVREREYTHNYYGLSANRSVTLQGKDGHYVYIDTKNGKSDVFASASDGKNEVQLTKLGTVQSIAFSPDESYVLVATTESNTNAFSIVGANGGTARKITESYNLNGSFSFKPPAAASP